jgi:hypothetical protein
MRRTTRLLLISLAVLAAVVLVGLALHFAVQGVIAMHGG